MHLEHFLHEWVGAKVTNEVVDDIQRSVDNSPPSVIIPVRSVAFPADLRVGDDLMQLPQFRENFVHQLLRIHRQVLGAHLAHFGVAAQNRT